MIWDMIVSEFINKFSGNQKRLMERPGVTSVKKFVRVDTNIRYLENKHGVRTYYVTHKKMNTTKTTLDIKEAYQLREQFKG